METLLQKPSELVVGCSFFKEQQKFKDSWHAFNWKCYGKLNHSPQRCPWPNARNLSSIQSLSHIWLWDPMDCSTPGFPVHHQLQELSQTLIHQVGDAIHHLILCHPFSSCLQSFPASGSFLNTQFFVSGDQSFGASASPSVPPMNIQDWSPLWFTGWISLQSKELLRVFSNTTVQKHQFFSTLPSLRSSLPSIHDYWKNHSFD